MYGINSAVGSSTCLAHLESMRQSTALEPVMQIECYNTYDNYCNNGQQNINICDPLNKNQTGLHYCSQNFYNLSTKSNKLADKALTLFICCEVTAINNRKSKTIDLCEYTESNYRCWFNSWKKQVTEIGSLSFHMGNLLVTLNSLDSSFVLVYV